MNLSRRSIYLVAVMLFAGLGAVTPRTLLAQIQKDTTHWNDEDLYKDEDRGAPSFFSVGGGLLGAYFKPDFSSGFNKNIAQPFTGKTYREQVYMMGGQGFITIPWIKNLRVGGLAYSGTSSDCGCTDTTIMQDKVGRFLKYQVGYGALSLDYVLPIRSGRFHIVPGVALGFGSVNIYARQAANQIQDFDIRTQFDGTNPYTTHTFTSHFFMYMPQIQFEYAPLGYMMFRLSAGYQGTSMGTWTIDQGVSLGNTAGLSGINGSGLVASLGLFLGIFQ